jgi:dTMP kinase
MNNGRFIVFEGIDGCGKSTQLGMVLDELINKNYKTIITREPGGTPIGEKIRDLLKSDCSFSKETEAYLFAASRCEHNQYINKLIEDDNIVLCDRHIFSSLAYQDYSFAWNVNEECMKLLKYKPILITYDISYDELIKRIANRNSNKDRFENRLNDEKNYNILRNKYKNINNIFHGHLINIDNKSIEEVHKETMDIIYKIFKEKGVV